MSEDHPMQPVLRDQELHARTAMADVLIQFARAIDSRDWDVYQSQFATAIEVDYRSLLGGDVLAISAADWAMQARRAFEGFETTQHFISNQVCQVDDGRGTCEAYVCAEHFARTGSELEFWTMGGNYRAEFEQTDEGWKIDKLRLEVLWSRGNPNIFEIASAGVPSKGR